MQETIKHATGTVASGLGFVGSITLHAVNEWASLTCAAVGIVAGICTIQSWWKGRNK